VDTKPECSNVLVLSFTQFPRRLEFDGKAVPTGCPMSYSTLGSIEEGRVGVPTPEVNERLSPGSLVVVVEQREPAAQCLHDFCEKELGLRILREGQHEQSPQRGVRLR
jgi:hypothetical protein